jgi:7-cyano-7-deazaguanine tRNA-ribosyltransferase
MPEKPLFWIGECRRPIKKDRSKDLVMDSAINYYNKENPRLAYQPGKLFLDNGAYTAKMTGFDLDIERVISIQEQLDPDQTIPVDYPFTPDMSIPQMKKLWDKTAENVLYWQSSTSLAGNLVPALHAWDKRSLIENLLWLQKNADSDYVALGSIVNPQFGRFDGFFGDRQPRRELIDMLCFAIGSVERMSDFGIHLMGFGSSPLTLHLGYYLGIRSTDSSGYRRKAAFGKIVLPSTGERYVGGGSNDFGVCALDKSKTYSYDIAMLDKCTCPVCLENKYKLWTDWKARAIHNEYVMKQETKKAERFISVGVETYEKYLDNVVFSKSGLRYLWEYAKLRRKYYRISQLLFEEESG